MAGRSRSALIKLRIVRDNTTRNALRGVTADMQRETKLAQRTQEKAAKESARIAMRAEKDKQKAIAKSTADSKRQAAAEIKQTQRTAALKVKEAERAASRELKLHERSMRERQRIAIRWMRQESRERAKEWRVRQRDESRAMARRDANARAGRQNIVAGVGGVAAAGIATLIAAVNKLSEFASNSRDKLGIVRAEDDVLNTKAAREEFVRSMTQAGQSQETMQATMQTLLDAANEFGVVPAQMLAAINDAQDTFSDPGFVTSKAGDIARLTRASGAEATDITRAGLTAKSKFNLNDDQVIDYLNALFTQTGEGSASFANIAQDFAASAAGIANAFGDKGRNIETAVGAGAIAQTMARSLKDKGNTKEESATVMTAWTDALTNTKTQKKLRKHGIDIADHNTGALKSLPEVMAELFSPANMEKMSPAVLNELFPEKRARLGMATLLEEARTNPERFDRLTNSGPEAGADMVDTIMENLRALPTEKINQMQVEAQSVALTSDNVITAMTQGAGVDVEAEKIARENLPEWMVQSDFNGSKTAGAIGFVEALATGDTETLTRMAVAGGGSGAGVGGTTSKIREGLLGGAMSMSGVGALAPIVNAIIEGFQNASSNTSVEVKVDGPASVTGMRQTGAATPIDVTSNGKRGTNG